jgi:hypothetical protein
LQPDSDEVHGETTLKFKCRTPSLLQDSTSRERSTVLTAESGFNKAMRDS